MSSDGANSLETIGRGALVVAARSQLHPGILPRLLSHFFERPRKMPGNFRKTRSAFPK
jgi:hypothetical protein